MTDKTLLVSPIPALSLLPPYTVGRPESGIDLVLDFNESLTSPDPLCSGANSYPELRPPLEAELAAGLGVSPDAVLLTCGADDALERAVRAVACPGRKVVLTSPTYGMIQRFALLSGAEVVEVPWWEGDLPVDELLANADGDTSLVAVVSPNNPTGAVASRAALRRLLHNLPDALVLVDQAYVDFAEPESDLLPVVLDHANAVAVRTFSKAWGAAGLRVGYAVGDDRVIDWMRRVGLPFPVSRPSAEAISKVLDTGPDAARIVTLRRQRAELRAVLGELGVETWPSQGSFVLARLADAELVWRGLAALGIAVRRLPRLPGCLRITLPGEHGAFERLESALRTVLAPAAMIFDLDGVLADVSRSYREAIIRTAAAFGVAIRPADITAAKARGNANNDWVLTRRLLAERGVPVELAELTRRFEALYQGTDANPGLRCEERLLLDREELRRLAARLPLAVVTGRPRRDALRFLADHRLEECFATVVAMEDAPVKPDPAPVRLALGRLGVKHAWMLGDTPDDMRAARAAGVLPIAVVAPGEDRAAASVSLEQCGAWKILETTAEILEVLP